MNKRILALVGIAMATATAASAAVSFSWGTTSGRVYNQNGVGAGNELSPASRTLYNSGCFVQLIYSTDGTIYDAINSGNGINPAHAAQNIVIATSWISRNIFTIPPGNNGQFSGQAFSHNYAAGSRFFIRAWNAPSSTYNGTVNDVNTSVPTGGSIRYGNSALYTTTADPGAGTAAEQFYLATGDSFATTLTPLPEPATVTLFGLGALALALRRDRKSVV